MAWTGTNPVTVGNPTKKSDYDKLWDNCDFFKIEHDTDGTHTDGVIKKAHLSNSATEADNVQKRIAKAWVNFNGTGAPAIRDDFNVSSITDNGTGDYTINFTSNMADTNYIAVYGGSDSTSTMGRTAVTYAVGSFRMRTYNSGTGTLVDDSFVSALILGS